MKHKLTYYLLVFICLLSITNNYAQNITNVEYYFDTEVGLGNATALTVTPGNTINETFPINTSGLSQGFHTLFIRAKNSNGVCTTLLLLLLTIHFL